jgi:hypothetical protein
VPEQVLQGLQVGVGFVREGRGAVAEVVQPDGAARAPICGVGYSGYRPRTPGYRQNRVFQAKS